MLRTHKDLDINYVESIVKRAVEEKKNIAWRMAYISIMASFVISLNVSLIMKIMDLKVINNDVMNGISLAAIMVIWCIVLLLTAETFYKISYAKLLQFQEAIHLYKLRLSKNENVL